MTKVNGDKTANTLTMLGHLCTDINQGAIAACMPFLIAHFGYSYTAVTALVFFANMMSAIIQPLFGTLSDRHPMPWLMGMGVFLSGAGMCGIGLATNLPLTYFFAAVSGSGIAMFHAEGGRVSNLAAGNNKSNGMSIFAVGGNIGFFVGPFLTAIFLNAFGMQGSLVFLVPAIGGALLLFSQNKRFVALGSGKEREDAIDNEQPEYWKNFWMVIGNISFRSVLTHSLMAFIPLFFAGILGQSEGVSSLALCFYSVAGAFATVVSGKFTDRFGVHRTIILCFAAAGLCCVWFAFNRSLLVAYFLVIVFAIVIDLFYPSQVALGMSYVPRHLGTASGFSYGIAVSVGGMAEPFLGMAGDTLGLPAVLLILAAVGFGGAIMALIVRREDHKLKGARFSDN